MPRLIDLFTRYQRRLESALAVCTLFLLSGAMGLPKQLLSNGPLNSAFSVLNHSIMRRGILLALFIGVSLLLIHNWRAVKACLRTTWPLFLPVMVAFSSVLWSVAPIVSLRSTVGLTGVTIVGLFLAVRFNVEEQLSILILVMGSIVCISLLAVLLIPKYAVMSDAHAGAWTGMFVHKNALGRTMALAVLVFLLQSLGMSKQRYRAVAGLALAIILIVGSASRNGLAVAIVCLIVVGFCYALKRLPCSRRVVLIPTAMSVAIVAAVWGVQHSDSILSVLGRDHTLTGRTELWTVLLDKARARPWLGYGYSAFWLNATPIPYTFNQVNYVAGVDRDVSQAVGWWYPSHAHNGFLDLELELGTVGVMSFLVPFVIFAYQAWTWGMAQESLLGLWPLSYLVFFVVSNLAESALVRQNTIYWVLYVAAVVTVRQRSAHTPQMPPGVTGRC